jgi:hypothetical protein
MQAQSIQHLIQQVNAIESQRNPWYRRNDASSATTELSPYGQEIAAIEGQVNFASRVLRDLCALMRQEIEPELCSLQVDYIGSGDSGSVESITLEKGADREAFSICLTNPEIEQLIDTLAWDIAYGSHPGFEINEGGQGVVRFSLDEETSEWKGELHHEENIVQVQSFDLALR